MAAEVVRRTPLNEVDFSGLPNCLSRVMRNRGLTEQDLDMQLKHLLPPNLKGLDDAVHRLMDARRQQQRVTIVGDFDCDGATSVSVAVLALTEAGFDNVDFIVPNRFEYGYGLTPEIVSLVNQRGADLIITVDNGISSVEGVAAANAFGIDVVVTDHHLPGQVLPEATAIVNPNQPDCSFESKALAGVGVMFYLLIALRQQLRKQGIGDIALANYLDLVAVGTVADVVPLDRNNRILVDQGIRRIRSGALRPGLDALLRVSGKTISRVTSRDLGFSVGPKINAAGRLDDISMGIRCLMSSSIAEALPIAEQLVSLNDERKAVEKQMRAQAEVLLSNIHLERIPNVITVFDPSFHEGVVGIVASRIKEKYHRPTIVFARTASGELKGSGRSIEGVHIRDLLDTAASMHSGLISKFGGHAMAAGLSLGFDDLAQLQSALDEAFEALYGDFSWQQTLLSDGELSRTELTDVEQITQLNALIPWGQNCHPPSFDGRFELLDQRIVGDNHLKLKVRDEHTEVVVDAICFNVDLNEWPNTEAQWVHLHYTPDVNEWRGNRSVQLLINQIIAIK